MEPQHRYELFNLYLKKRNELGKINKFRITGWNTGLFRYMKGGEYILLQDVYVFDEDSQVIYYDHIHIKLSKKKKEMFEKYPNTYIEFLAHPIVYTRKNGTRDFSFGGVLTDSIQQLIY